MGDELDRSASRRGRRGQVINAVFVRKEIGLIVFVIVQEDSSGGVAALDLAIPDVDMQFRRDLRLLADRALQEEREKGKKTIWRTHNHKQRNGGQRGYVYRYNVKG